MCNLLIKHKEHEDDDDDDDQVSGDVLTCNYVLFS